MKRFMRLMSFLVVFAVALTRQNVSGQSIIGDTIFVSVEAEIGIKFPSRPSSYYINPKDAPYNLVTIPSGFTIGAKSENTNPALLFVTEGANNHQFVLVFKKKINFDNPSELYFDYSTKKKLAQHIKELDTKKYAAIQENAKTETKVVPNRENKNAVSSNDQKNNSANYYILIEEGEKKMKLGLYDEAKLNFDKAHELRPDDLIPLQRLEEIKIKLDGKEKFVDAEKNNKYTKLTGQAKSLFDLKKYQESKEVYSKALVLRTGDLYVTNQLEKIDKILNNEKGRLEQKRLQELYSNYMTEGEKALNKNMLADARIAFEQALVIKQNDPTAIARIRILTEKENHEKEIQAIGNNYLESIQTADKLYLQKNYVNSKNEYTKALGYFKRPWPIEQIKNIDKILADLTSKEIAEKQQQAKQAEIERKEKELGELENKYNVAISEGDKLYRAGDNENAKVAYTNAIRIYKRPWPKEQIGKINLKFEEQSKQAINEKQRLVKQAEIDKLEKESLERENNYAITIQSADKLFQAGNVENAKEEYMKANSIIKRPWPDEQIIKINKIVIEKAAAENTEKKRLENETRVANQYNSIIQNADIEFDKNNYIYARRLYTDASLLKPGEKYPQERLQIIQNSLEVFAKIQKIKKDSIAAVTKLKKKYDLALSRGNSFNLKEDYANAKIAYEEAAALKSGDVTTQTQLNKINMKLDEIAKEKELNVRYDNKISQSDSLLIAEDYDHALIAFKEASVINPSETYPGKQIKFIQQEIKIKVYNDSLVRERQRIEKYNTIIRNADKALIEKRFADAILGYTNALALNPSNESLQRGLKIATYQNEIGKKRVQESPRGLEPKPLLAEIKKTGEIDKKNIARPNNQKELAAYTIDELKIKYPGIDFTALPPQQPFNKEAVTTIEMQEAFKEVLSEKSRLNLSASDHSVTMICQGIFFENKSCNLRFLIENNSETDFLTGAMMLTWTRKLGNKLKLYPSYIYPAFLPVIKPGSEAVVIYVCKSYNVDDDEKIEFELIDRVEKVKLKLGFLGKVYNEEFSK